MRIISTRSTTHFTSGGETAAIIYRHNDGYPEGHGHALQEFFEAVEKDTKDTRYSDPAYLAAKLVVYLARDFASGYVHTDTGFEHAEWANERPLDFISVGVVMKDPGDIEYRYLVDCGGNRDDNGRPVVTCIDLHGDGETVVGIPARADVEVTA